MWANGTVTDAALDLMSATLDRFQMHVLPAGKPSGLRPYMVRLLVRGVVRYDPDHQIWTMLPSSAASTTADEGRFREALHRHFGAQPGTLATVAEVRFTLLEERADFLIVRENGLAVVEIKSDRDSLTRLLRQLDRYHQAFREVWIAAGARQLAGISRRQVPDTVGLMTLDGDDIKVLRPAAPSDQRDSKTMLEIFWRDELKGLGVTVSPRATAAQARKKATAALDGKVDEIESARVKTMLDRVRGFHYPDRSRIYV